jgi:putative phage-type endonuclease
VTADYVSDADVDMVLAVADKRHTEARRDTPTGTIIARLDPQVDRPLWLALRRTGIGSSDMAAVLGMSKYRSELDVYMDKVGDTPLDSDTAGEAAMWGTILEDPVARVWADRHDVYVKRVGTIAHVDRRHLLCDLDRLVVGCPDHKRCALEVKTRSAWKSDEWKDGAIPEDVEAQVMQQLAVTGLDAIHVAGLVGGQRLESRVILPDPEYIADLFKIADQFWHENVLPRVAPDISSLELLEAHLSRLAPEKGIVADLDDAEVREVKHLTRIIVSGVQAGLEAKEAEQKLKAIIGADATDVALPGPDGKPVTWWTWRSRPKNRQLDQSAVARDLGVENLDAYKVSTGTQRTLLKGAPVKAMLEGADDE